MSELKSRLQDRMDQAFNGHDKRAVCQRLVTVSSAAACLPAPLRPLRVSAPAGARPPLRLLAPSGPRRAAAPHVPPLCSRRPHSLVAARVPSPPRAQAVRKSIEGARDVAGLQESLAQLPDSVVEDICRSLLHEVKLMGPDLEAAFQALGGAPSHCAAQATNCY